MLTRIYFFRSENEAILSKWNHNFTKKWFVSVELFTAYSPACSDIPTSESRPVVLKSKQINATRRKPAPDRNGGTRSTQSLLCSRRAAVFGQAQLYARKDAVLGVCLQNSGVIFVYLLPAAWLSTRRPSVKEVGCLCLDSLLVKISAVSPEFL